MFGNWIKDSGMGDDERPEIKEKRVPLKHLQGGALLRWVVDGEGTDEKGHGIQDTQYVLQIIYCNLKYHLIA